MCNQIVLVVSLLLSSCLPMEAQRPATQVVRLSLVVLPIQLPSRPLPNSAFLSAAARKPEPSLESWLPIEEVRTSFLTETRFLVAHLWRGLQLDVFDSTIHSQSLQLGPPSSGSGFQNFRPSSHDQAGIASSVGFDGISLRYSFGWDAETRKPTQLWRCVSWVIGNGRGCTIGR